jgi:TP901 family phage tail tape measure protein
VADLQVSLGFLLENVADVAKELERAGGLAGRDFGKGLNEGTRKAFDDLVSAADKAAKEAGLRFNRQKLQFETVKGDIVPPQALASIGKTVKGLDEARKAVDAFKSAVQATARQSTSSFNLLEGAVQGVAFSLANTLTNGLGSALGSLKGMVSGFIELDGELRLAAAAAGETGGYERLSAVVEKVGIDAAGTGKQVAELATSLVRAGFSVKEVEAALPGVVRGAEATGTGFQQFGDIVGNTLRGFGLDVEKTADVVDILTNTANSSNASIEGLGYTFEYTAPIAKALGVSLEDVAAATGLMANAGIQGSVAGTGLREALTKLQQAAGGASPEVLGLSQGQERLQAVMQKLGISIIDTQGKLLPLDQVFLKLKGSLEQLSQGDQVQLANILFGDQAGNKILAITNQTTTAITKMFSDIRNSTGATDEARNAMAGFGLELQQLQGTIDSLGNKVGQTFATALRPLLGIANQVVGAISELPEPVKVTASLLIGMGAAAAAASVGMAALKLTLAQVGFVAIKNAVMGAAAAIVGPFAASTAVILGIGVAVGLMTGQFKNVDATTKQLIVTIGALSAAYLTFIGIASVSKLAGIATIIQYIVASVKAWTIATKGQTIAQAALNTIQYGMAGVVAIITRIIQAYDAFRKSTTLLAGAQAALAVLTGGKLGLAKVALAATAAAGTYALLNGMIQESGQATEELSKEQENLQSEIDSTKKMIADQQEMGISTDAAEKRLAELEAKKASLSEPLALSIEIDQAEKKYDQLSEKAKKTAEGGGKAAAEAQAAAAKGWEEFLRAVQSGQGLDSFSEPLREGGKELRALSDQIFELMKTQVNLPLTATAEREQIDKQIAELQKRLDDKKLKLRLELEQKDIKEKIDEVTKKKFDAVRRNASEEEMNNLDKEMERLILLQARNQKELIGSQAKGAAIAKDNVLTEAQRAAILKTQSAETEARIAKEIAAGTKTKSQAAEELRQQKLITLEKEKQLKLKELAAIPVANQNTGRGLELRNEIATIDRDVANVQVEQREESLENEISLIGTAKVEYEAYLTKLRAAGAITKNQYDNEILYLQRVALEREKAVKERELGGIGDQTSQEALRLRQEIAGIDKNLSDNKMAVAQNSYDKAVEEVELQRQKLELIGQEVDLNKQAGDNLKSSYEAALQYAQALLEYTRARNELIQSEFALEGAYNNRAVMNAEARLAQMQRAGSGASKSDIASQEERVNRLKEEGKRIAIAAKKAEIEGLEEVEAGEWRALNLKQRMALIDQQARIMDAKYNVDKQRQLLIELQVKRKDPNLTSDQRKGLDEQIKLQRGGIKLAEERVKLEEDRYKILVDQNRIERQTLSMNQQARRNRMNAELINLGGRFAGGPVDPRFAYTVNELGMESFLSATGTISWIHKPAYGTWSPPARGIVLPAGLSQQLMEAGALPPHPGVPQRSKRSLTRVEQVSQAVSMNMNGNMLLAMRKQSLELGKLQKSIDTLAGKDWNVNVRTPSNAGLIRTLQGL